MELIEGRWRIVSSKRAKADAEDQGATARFIGIVIAIAAAIVLRLWIWGPIHH